MAEANGRTDQAASWQDKAGVLLYVPNLVDYARVLVFSAAFLLAGDQRPITFAALYLLCFALDGLDGYAARRLNQVSAFGAFVDVFLDNTFRAVMWAAALRGPAAALVPCVEWGVFVGTHARGGAAWKTGCFVGAPHWVSAVFANNFKNPLGVVVMAGLHFLPLWVWLYLHAPNLPLSHWSIGAVLVIGRSYCMAVELWTLSRHLGAIIAEDVSEAKAKAH